MKKLLLIVIPIFIFALSLQANIGDTNRTEGLYIETSLFGRYNPYDGVLNVNFFYRYPLIKSDHFLFNITKFDVGVENDLGIGNNTVRAYIDIIPIRFLKLSASIGYMNYYNVIPHQGFFSFENPEDEYNEDVLKELDGSSASAFFIELEPGIRIDVYKFTLLADLKISYIKMNKGNYFYDYSTFLLRKSEDLSYALNVYLMFNIYPINVGMNYALSHTQFASNTGHRLGVVGSFEYDFSDRFNIYGVIHVGEYLNFKHFSYSVYIDAKVGIQYRIL